MSRALKVRALVLGVAAATTATLVVAAPADAISTAPRAGALPTLSMGATGAAVSSLQRTLAVRATGVYDSATYAAVKRVQVWKGIKPANGVVGSATWVAVKDPTLTYRMRTSPTARKTMTLKVFQTSVHGYGIAYRESKLTCTAVSPSGAYRGKWQMSKYLWHAYGGWKYAKFANRAKCWQQDAVALNVWRHNGWRPWGG